MLWRSLRLGWSPAYRQKHYEDQAELVILWAYETASRFEAYGQQDPGIFKIIDEILEFKDDPKYISYSAENFARVMVSANGRGDANLAFIRDRPEQHALRVRKYVAHFYGYEDLDEDVAKDPGVWKRISDLSVEQRKEELRIRGPDIEYVLGYESRVKDHQITIEAVKQVEKEGLLDSTKLFLRGGNHESVSRDVEAFDRLLYVEWESILECMDEKESREEYREFLGRRTKIWGQEYLRWLS